MFTNHINVTEDEMSIIEMFIFGTDNPDADKEHLQRKEKLTIACWLRALTIFQTISDPGEEYIGMHCTTCFPLRET